MQTGGDRTIQLFRDIRTDLISVLQPEPMVWDQKVQHEEDVTALAQADGLCATADFSGTVLKGNRGHWLMPLSADNCVELVIRRGLYGAQAAETTGSSPTPYVTLNPV